MNRLFRPRKRDEAGVVAILVAVLSIVLLMFAAYAVDIGMQVNRKHQLNDTLDAAAQAGAFELPGSTTNAESKALEFATAHDPTETGSLAPNVDFWCVVASVESGGTYSVDLTQIPATCYPGTPQYTAGIAYKGTGRKVACSQILCAIPCVQPTPNNGTPKIACNTIRVYQGRDVPFQFAPAGGIMKGSTGNIISVACKGSCGTVAPNPMDVAIVADRTQSMGNADIDNMIGGIKGMLQQMTASQQYVSLGTIGRSQSSTTNQASSRNCNSSSRGLTYGSTSGGSGLWMPIAFSNDYVNGSQQLQGNSTLVKGVNCLENQSDIYQGTVLASPMKAAARYLLGYDNNNLSSLPERTAPPTKVLIFETDGEPNEHESTQGSTNLTQPGDIFSHTMSLDPNGVTSTQPDTEDTSSHYGQYTTTITHHKRITYTYNGGAQACQNLIDVAANARAAGILVIMIGYNMSSKQCNDYDGQDDNYSNKTNYTADVSTRNGPESDTTVRTCDRRGRNCVNVNVEYKTETETKWVKQGYGAPVLNILAQSASPNEGVPASAQSDCSNTTEREAENSDGDYLFCAASGSDMAPIFKTALSQVSKGIKLINLP